MKNYIIRREEEKDYRETENLTREAFWNVYCPGCREHYVLHLYRNDKDFVPELDYVMVIRKNCWAGYLRSVGDRIGRRKKNSDNDFRTHFHRART